MNSIVDPRRNFHRLQRVDGLLLPLIFVDDDQVLRRVGVEFDGDWLREFGAVHGQNDAIEAGQNSSPAALRTAATPSTAAASTAAALATALAGAGSATAEIPDH